MDSGKVGAFIAQLRREKGLTQQGLADSLSVTNKAVSKWETGDGYPEITMLPTLADALGVTADELLRGERAAKASAETHPPDVGAAVGNTGYAHATLKFRNMSMIAGCLAAAGIVAFYVITWAAYLEMVGFGVLMAFLITGFVLFMVQRNNLRAAQPDGQTPAEAGKISAILIYLWSLGFFAALPYLLFDNGLYLQSILALPSYAVLLPIFIALGWFTARFICVIAASQLGIKDIPGLAFESADLRKHKLWLNLFSILYLIILTVIIFISQGDSSSISFFAMLILYALCVCPVIIRFRKSKSTGILILCAARNVACSVIAAFAFVSSASSYSISASDMPVYLDYAVILILLLIELAAFTAFTAVIWYIEWARFKKLNKAMLL